jgi:hypothetical protein
MSDKKKLAARAAVLLLLPAGLFLLNAWKLDWPTAQWDGWVLMSAGWKTSGLLENGYFYHPPLYICLAWAADKFSALPMLNEVRAANFALWGLSGWLVFALGRLLGRSAGAGLLAAALYYTSPLALQGQHLLDLGDTALVPLTISAYSLLLVSGAGGRFNCALLAAGYALNLWTKFIHAFFMAAAAALSWLNTSYDAATRRNAGCMAAGLLLFLATWAAYAWLALAPDERLRPFEYFVNGMLLAYQSEQAAGGLKASLYDKGVNIFRILLWTWPALLLWAASAARRGFGDGAERWLHWYTGVFIAAALVSKNTSNGFPKYHAAVLPLLCAAGAAWAYRSLAALPPMAQRRLALAAAAGGALCWLGGDPIYTFNHGFKAALLAGEGLGAAALKLGGQLLLPAAGAWLAWAAAGRVPGRRLAAFLAAALGWQAAMAALQSRAPYFTTYGYGTTGKADVIRALAAGRTAGLAFGPNEFETDLRDAGVPFRSPSDKCQLDKGCLLANLRDPAVTSLVFGTASNTVEQVRWFLSLGPGELGREVNAGRHGDFWLARLGPPVSAGGR